MIQANMHEAKTQLSKLIERAEAGEEVMIARNGKPVVRLTPVEGSPTVRTRTLAGRMEPVPAWAEWKESDLEVAELFEAAINAPEPWLDDRPPDPPPEEMARLRALSTEELVRELTRGE